MNQPEVVSIGQLEVKEPSRELNAHGGRRWAVRLLIAFVAVFVAASAMAAPQSPRVSPVPAPQVWPDRVRLVGTGTVVYPGKRPITTHVKFDIIFVRAQLPDPSLPGAWYVPAPKSVVTQWTTSPTDQWCPILPRTAVVPINPQQSFLALVVRASGTAVLVSALVNAVREPEITTGIATCSRSAWGQSVLVFQTLPNAQSVIGEEGATASLVAGAPFPTAQAKTVVRMDASSPTLTSTWTLSPVAN